MIEYKEFELGNEIFFWKYMIKNYKNTRNQGGYKVGKVTIRNWQGGISSLAYETSL